jgi:DNA polymerase III delta prime subunit
MSNVQYDTVNSDVNEIINANISIPWVEKYRPTEFDKIVLDPLNKRIMENILKKNHFPNLLLYGPPGTGKTTTIINLVNAYQEKFNQKNKGLMIHLNASDERGIDIIRNQINSFVNSTGLFSKGLKFVILDEVDYMTKNAQQALKYLLQSYNNNVRFCLICNYISRIDESLQNEFLRLRFNQLPQKEIIRFLMKINENEKINLSSSTIESIQKLYKSDIRSMINYMQTNQNLIGHYKVIGTNVWDNLTKTFLDNESKDNIIEKINSISREYNIEIKNIMKDYLNYIIRSKPLYITCDMLNFIEFIMHIQDPNINYFINYSIIKLKGFLLAELE